MKQSRLRSTFCTACSADVRASIDSKRQNIWACTNCDWTGPRRENQRNSETLTPSQKTTIALLTAHCVDKHTIEFFPDGSVYLIVKFRGLPMGQYQIGKRGKWKKL